MMNPRKPILIITLFMMIGFGALLSGCVTGTQYNGGLATQDPAPVEVNTPTIANAPAAQNAFSNLPPVKVAILLPLSGAQGEIGQAMLQAAQLALFDIGYNNFNLMPRDTGGNAAQASAAATAAINDGAQIILGPLFADSVRAVKAVAKPRNVNVIAFSTDWSLADNSTYLMGFMPFAQVDRITEYATQSGYKNIAVIAPRDNYGDLVTGRFEKALRDNNGTLTASIRYTTYDASVTAEVAALKEKNIQAVFMPVNGTQAETISNALTQNGMPPTQVKRLGTGLWDDPRLSDKPEMAGAWFASPAPRARQAFESNYVNTYGQKPPRLATLAYDATALAAALAKNGFDVGGKPAFNSGAITNRNGFSGTDGAFRFAPNGLIERSLSVLEIKNGQFIEVAPARKGF